SITTTPHSARQTKNSMIENPMVGGLNVKSTTSKMTDLLLVQVCDRKRSYQILSWKLQKKSPTKWQGNP
ncbi:MAG: hypothetical protein AAFR59_13400, partial [Bacteroidota bacterium]